MPRTGGTTIHNALAQDANTAHLIPEVKSVCHYSYDRYKTIPAYNEVWDSYLKFATVRNPFDWLISLYNHPCGPSYRAECPCPKPNSPVNIAPSVKGARSFEEYVRCPTLFTHESPYISQSRSIGPDIDFIIKFENLQEGFDELCERIGRPKSKLLVVQPTLKRDKEYKGYYTPELVESVTKIFDEDLKRFSYSYESYWNMLCNKYKYLNKKEISND